MGLDGIHQPGQHRGPEACFVQDLNAGVRGGRVEEGRADLLPRPAEGGVGAEELGAAVRRVGVGIHDATRQLAQLAHMADEQHFLKPGGGRHVQRVTNEVGALDHRDLFQLGQGAVEVIQPIVARGQDQPLGRTRVGAEASLIHFQLDGVQQGLLTHGLHDAAGAQHAEAALHPDMGVERPLGHLGTALNGNRHGKTARITGGFGFFLQGLRDHLPGNMIDGGFAHRLVKARLCHQAHPRPAEDLHIRAFRFQDHFRRNGQAGGHIGIVTAVLFHHADSTVFRWMAGQRGHLHHNAFWGAESDRFRRASGQQEPGGSCRAQCRTGAGGITAAEQFLPAADIVLEFGSWLFGGLCLRGRRLHRGVRAIEKRVFLRCQVVDAADIFFGERFFGRQHTGNSLGRDADHFVRNFAGEIQLMQTEQNGHVLLPGQLFQDAQQFHFALDIQKRRRLIQQNDLWLLADGPGQQHPLALAIADLVEIPVSEGLRAHQSEGGAHLRSVLCREDAQPPGVGVAARRRQREAGGELRAAGVGQHQGHFAGPGVAGQRGKLRAVQQHRTALRSQLARQRFEQGGFARAVGAHEGQDLAPLHPQRDIL